MKFDRLKTSLRWIKDRWNDLMSLDMSTHIQFRLTANSKIDYLLSMLQTGSSWVVSIITGFGTYMMISEQLKTFEAPNWIVITLSSVVALFMWVLTDFTLGAVIEIVCHNALSILFKPFWSDFGKHFKRFGRKKKPATTTSPDQVVQGSQEATEQATEPRYSIPSRFIQMGITALLGFLIYKFYLIDYQAVKVIQQPIADVVIHDTTRNVIVERAAIINQTQPTIDRLTKEVKKYEALIDEAWKYSVNRPQLSEFKKILDDNPKNGWAKSKIRKLFYNNYVAGLNQRLQEVSAQKDKFEADQAAALAIVNKDVKTFNEGSAQKKDRQTAMIFAVIFALGFVAKQVYGVAVVIRVAYYMSETNGGKDLNGDGVVDRKDIQAFYTPAPAVAGNF